MRPAVVDAARTPFGTRDGWLAPLHAAELLHTAHRGVLDRLDLDPQVEQVITVPRCRSRTTRCGPVAATGRPWPAS